MKKILATLLAGALIAPASAALAAPPMHHKQATHVVHKTVTKWRFAKGQRFDRARADHYARIDYHHYRRLSPPPRGYMWVRSGRDAVLVRTNTNIVAQVIADIFN